MASLPDGVIFSMKSVDKGMGIQFKEIGKLIKCKNCIFSTVKDIVIADGIISKNNTVCEEFQVSTNPEGYCWKAVRKDVLDG